MQRPGWMTRLLGHDPMHGRMAPGGAAAAPVARLAIRPSRAGRPIGPFRRATQGAPDMDALDKAENTAGDATARARARERQRCATIMAHPLARRLPKVVAVLAFETRLVRVDALACLDALAVDIQRTMRTGPRLVVVSGVLVGPGWVDAGR